MKEQMVMMIEERETIDRLIAYYNGMANRYEKEVEKSEKEIKAFCDIPEVAAAFENKDVGNCMSLMYEAGFDRGLWSMSFDMVRILRQIKQGDIIINKTKESEE